MNDYVGILSLDDLRLKINLGVTEGEREQKQDISIFLKFYFKEHPKATEEDNIDKTICYQKMSDIAKSVCSKKSYKTLEFLSACVYKEIRREVDKDIMVSVKINKLNPPIAGVVGASSYEYISRD